jgi:hypothetical protein
MSLSKNRSIFYTLFLRHPHAAGETYWRHLCFTTGMALRFARASVIIVIHGFLPFLFEHTSSDEIAKIFEIMRARNPKYAGDQK